MKTTLSFASFASFAAIALLPIFVVSACGGDSEFNSDREDESIPLDDLPAAFAGAYCDLFARCAPIYSDILFSLEDCDVLFEERARQGGWSDIEQAVDDGRVTYSGKTAADCIKAIDGIADDECASVNDRPIPACEDMMKGSLAAGEECDMDEECAEGICNTNDMCPGECAPLRPMGQPCQEDGDCATTLVCSEVTRLCAVPGAEGAACGGGIEAQCDGGLACIGEDSMEMQTGTCRPFSEIELAGVNETCNLDEGLLCESGLSCVVVSLDGPAFECRAIPASGGTCGIGFPENCPKGQYCPVTAAEILLGDLEANCTDLPADGEACAARPIDFLPACAAYTRCNAATSMCMELRDLGESCTSPDQCYSGTCVNGGCTTERACQ
jgi:hypothetical protein